MKTATIPHLSLVGAGPGDPDMITLKAVKTIRSAKVILYDALANQTLLQHAAPDVITTFVGKRFGCHALSQQAINQLIVENALRYGHVVRLKGGDPFVFGRAQEEIDCARSHGITVSVVPGISSAIAVPAMQMIPVTCRGIAESFWVTTGTTRSGDISADVQLAAQSSATVILLMAMSKLEQIMDLFAAHGKAATPVAIIQEGCTGNEKIVTGTVKDILFKAQYGGFTNPAIIIIGEVVNLHPSVLKEKVPAAATAYRLTGNQC